MIPIFMLQIKRIPSEIFRLLGLPVPTYAYSSSKYALTNIVRSVLGVDIFTLMFIFMLYILASLALVSIVLPNIYFRLMLWADVSSQDLASIYDDYEYQTSVQESVVKSIKEERIRYLDFGHCTKIEIITKLTKQAQICAYY